jgi:hypothetical protein
LGKMMFNDGTNSFVRHAKISGQLSEALTTVMSLHYLIDLVLGEFCRIGLLRLRQPEDLSRNQSRKKNFVPIEEWKLYGG